MITKISSLCGIRQDTIKEIWQYTIFTMLLDIMEKKDAGHHTAVIPFLGKFLIKPSTEDPSGIDSFFIMNPELKDNIRKIRAGMETGLVSFFEENFVNKMVENITDEERGE